MGGYGSGRWHGSRYALVERSFALGLEWLHQTRELKRGVSQGSLHWMDGQAEVAGIGWTVSLDSGRESTGASGAHLTLRYPAKHGDAPFEGTEQRFALVTTRPQYGGVRWWVVCVCGRRVAKLYLPWGRSMFRCRRCHQLRYSSQRLTVPSRWEHRARKIVARLGGEAGDGLVYKPKGMRCETFDRLMDEVQTLNDDAACYRFRGLLKPNSWLSRAVRHHRHSR